MPLVITDSADIAYVGRALAAGAVVATAFGNIYGIISRPAAETVRGINLAKGRPIDEVGSITTTRSRIAEVFDWARLPHGVRADAVHALMDDLWTIGPFGFRGPAAEHVPDHLACWDAGTRTTQVIAPGYGCPSNAVFDSAMELMGERLLYITSANRSRHLTGAVEEPAHWSAACIVEDFRHVTNLVVIEHPDEAAARAAYPGHLPTSVTLLSLHACGYAPDGVPVLSIDRHGSLDATAVAEVAARHGFDVTLGPGAMRRVQVRQYERVAA
jgi:hypothetical protein